MELTNIPIKTLDLILQFVIYDCSIEDIKFRFELPLTCKSFNYLLNTEKSRVEKSSLIMCRRIIKAPSFARYVDHALVRMLIDILSTDKFKFFFIFSVKDDLIIKWQLSDEYEFNILKIYGNYISQIHISLSGNIPNHHESNDMSLIIPGYPKKRIIPIDISSFLKCMGRMPSIYKDRLINDKIKILMSTPFLHCLIMRRYHYVRTEFFGLACECELCKKYVLK